MPSTSRRAVLGLLAGVVGVAGCAGRDPSGPVTETERRTSTRPTQSTTTGARPPDEPTLTAPRPSTLDAVDADWPSHASPVVADGVAVALGHRGTVTAFDAADGSERWQVDLAENPQTPAVVDGTLYVLTYSLDRLNELVALDVRTGEREWAVGRFEEAFGDLTATDDAVYAAVDEAVVAFDSATGERRWRTPFPDAGSTHGPVTVVDDRVVVPDAGGSVVALDAATGERVWTAGSSGVGRDPWRVLAAHDRLYVSTSRGHTDAYDTPTVHALDRDGGHVGSYATEGANWPGLAATADGVVAVDRVDYPPDRPPTTPVQTVEATPAGTPPSTATRPPKPTYADRLTADLSREERVRLPTSSWRGGPPAVAGEFLYVGSRAGVAAAVDLTAGEPAWQYTFDTALDLTGPAVADGVCVFGSAAGLITLAAE
jgi:outer membrane protein assembly factor BamB